MAEGPRTPVDEVFTRNCRGDLVRSTSDGCTTLAGVGAEDELIIVYNEDGLPQLRGDCAVAHATPSVGLVFTSFTYPGSPYGRTFAMNKEGIANTVNNIRVVHRPEGTPRRILARASLSTTTLDEAITLLTATPRAGAFYHTLGQMGDSHLSSAEVTGSGSSVRKLTATSGHANHLVHSQLATIKQIVTGGSGSRQ